MTLCVVILVSILAEARDAGQVRLTINASPQAVKTVATEYLSGSGYVISSEGQAQTVFVKDMESLAGFLTGFVQPPSSCESIAPRLFLTLNFSETAVGTLATISAQVEHTALFERVYDEGPWLNHSPIYSTMSYCETVRDAPIRKQRAVLKDILEKVRTYTEMRSPQNTAPTMNVDTDIRRLPQGEERWPTLLGF